MRKKLLSMLFAVTMITTALYGCGNNSSSGKTDSEVKTETDNMEETEEKTQTASSAEEITLHFWNSFTGSDGDILREYVKEFNETNEHGITVEMDIMPWDSFSQKLPQSISTNTAPDMVLWGYDGLGAYVEEGAFQSLNDYWEKGNVPKEDFYPSIIDLYNIDGVQYEIPFVGYGATYYYWNKDLFTAAGLDPEKPGTTWDEVIENAKKITDASQNIYGMAVPSGDLQLAHAMIVGAGYGWYDEETNLSDLTQPEVMEVFQRLQNAVQVDKISPENVTGNEYDTLFANGQIGQYFNGPWLLNGIRKSGVNFGVTVLPEGPVSIGSSGLAVPSTISEERKLAVYKFFDYLLSEEKVKDWSLKNGFPPVRISVGADQDIAGDPVLNAYAQGLETAVARYVGSQKIPTITSEVAAPMYELICFGNADVKESCEKAAEQMNEILAEQ